MLNTIHVALDSIKMNSAHKSSRVSTCWVGIQFNLLTLNHIFKQFMIFTANLKKWSQNLSKIPSESIKQWSQPLLSKRKYSPIWKKWPQKCENAQIPSGMEPYFLLPYSLLKVFAFLYQTYLIVSRLEIGQTPSIWLFNPSTLSSF